MDSMDLTPMFEFKKTLQYIRGLIKKLIDATYGSRLERVYQPRIRRLIQIYISGLVNLLNIDLIKYSRPISPKSLQAVSQLRSRGFYVFEDYVSAEEIETIGDFFATKMGFNAHIPSQSDGILRGYTESYEYSMLAYSTIESFRAPLILDLILSPVLIDIARQYLGCIPTCYSVNTYRTFPNKDYATHRMHRDFDDFKFLAVFLYLDNVEMENGPFVYYPRTHRSTKVKPSAYPITGPKGTIAITDAWGLHHGSVPEKTRFACWWRYGLWRNYSFYNDQNNMVKLDSSTYSSLNPEEQYIMRLFHDL